MTDRELDALLAAHLFGWKRVATTRGQTFLVPADYPDGPYDEDAIKYSLTPERYSTSGNGMLLVVGAMRAKGWQVSVDSFGSTKPVEDWRCKFGNGPLPPGTAFADTAPRAVAIAACRALGLEVPE